MTSMKHLKRNRSRNRVTGHFARLLSPLFSSHLVHFKCNIPCYISHTSKATSAVCVCVCVWGGGGGVNNFFWNFFFVGGGVEF